MRDEFTTQDKAEVNWTCSRKPLRKTLLTFACFESKEKKT